MHRYGAFFRNSSKNLLDSECEPQKMLIICILISSRLLEDSSMCEFWTDSQQESSFFNNDFEAQQTRATQVEYSVNCLFEFSVVCLMN